jgi:pimeloyl-ACP methyl ester carboxylesterase
MNRFNHIPQSKQSAFIFCLTVFISLAVLLTAGSIMQTAAAQSESPGQWSDPSPHKVLFVTVAPGVQLEVLDWGGNGEPLVFLAGLTMNAHAFDDFAHRFTETHRVVGITRRGHGASSWPEEGYSLERRLEDIRVVLDSLGMEHVVFAGHSLAGKEITQPATEYPERIKGLIHIDAANDLSLIKDLRLNESFDNLPSEECAEQEEPCDLPLDRTALERYMGEYEVPGQEVSARVYVEDGSLMILSPGLPPRRLLYRGNDEFRLAEYPAIRLLFEGAGEQATSYIVLSGMVMGTGKRMID